MTTGRHHIKRKVVYKEKVFDQRTARIVAYNRSVLTKPRPKLNPVASCALGVVAAFAIAVAALGDIAPADPPEEPAVVVTVAVPVAVTARPVEPVEIVPAVAPVVRKRLVRNRPAVRVAPVPVRVETRAPAPVKKQAPVKDKRKKKDNP